jgi:RNA polymerase sigma-70 factor (ECF subfamily)
LFSRTDKQLGSGPSPSIGLVGRAAASGEQALIEAAKNFDDAAWEEIYRRHAEQVYTYLYFRVRDQQVAEDLAADVFVRALAGIEGFEWRGTPLLAWLYRIAHNVAADHRRNAALTSQHQVTEFPVEIADPANLARTIDDQTDVLDAVRSLTEDQQHVIILRFYLGMSTRQVAGVIGKHESAVKALQARALRSLRRFLTEGDEELKSA